MPFYTYSLQFPCLSESLVTFQALEWSLVGINSFMILQIIFDEAFVVAVGAAEWFITIRRISVA